MEYRININMIYGRREEAETIQDVCQRKFKSCKNEGKTVVAGDYCRNVPEFSEV